MTSFIRTKNTLKVGGYPNIYLREDYGLWAKMINEGSRFHNIDENLVHANGGYKLIKEGMDLKVSLQSYIYSFFFIRIMLNLLFICITFLIRGFAFYYHQIF